MSQDISATKVALTEVISECIDSAIKRCVDLPGGVPRSRGDLASIMVTAARGATAIYDEELRHQVTGAQCRLAIYGHRPGFTNPDGRLMLLADFAKHHDGIDASKVERVILGWVSSKNGSMEKSRELLARVSERVDEIWGEVEAGQEKISQRGAEIYKVLSPLLPAKMSLRRHQQDYLALAEERGWKLANCDDQGMGKTVEALASLLLHSKRAFPALVIAPTSVTANWGAEADRWLSTINPRIIEVGEDLKMPKTARERALDRDIAKMKRAIKREDPPPPERSEVEEWLGEMNQKYADVMKWITLSLGPEEIRPKIRRSCDRDLRAEALGLEELESLPRRRIVVAGDLLKDRISRGRLKSARAIDRARLALMDGLSGSDFAEIRVSGRRVGVHVDQDKLDAWKKRPLLVIASWSEILTHGTILGSVKWASIIGDETHLALRNHDSQTTRAFWRLRAGTLIRLAMSGTMMPNGRPAQAFATIKAVRPDLVKGFHKFGMSYCGPTSQFVSDGRGGSRAVITFKGRSNEPDFAELLSKVQVRRLKTELGEGELPPKLRYGIRVNLSTADKLDLAIAKDNARAEMEGRAEKLMSELMAAGEDVDVIKQRVSALRKAIVPTALQAARELTGTIKARRWLLPFAVEKSSMEDPLVIFCAHHTVHTLACKLLRERFGEDSVLAGTGSMGSAQKRKSLVERWQGGEGRFLVLTKAFGQGITVTRARNLVLLERYWEPGQEAQTEDRVHRFTQLRDVGIFYPHAVGSTDDIVGELITWKDRGINQLQGSAAERAIKWMG